MLYNSLGSNNCVNYNWSLILSPYTEENVAGVVCWNRPQAMADGDSVTLYDLKEGSTSHHGDPIADVFAILARPNSCILAVADGCGWGPKPRLAARCAVRGSIEHLNSKLFQMTSEHSEQISTHDIFHAMYRAMHSAQKCIIKHGGTTTTLCLAVVVELAEIKAGNKWGVCVVSVGDSVCYVWRHNMEEVHEITMAFAEGQERNQMDSGGCLGADMGDHPDLTNLHCCYAPLADNDIVFLVSDGVSDNFDPVTLREGIPESCIVTNPGCTSPSPPSPLDISPLSSVPTLSPIQRKHLATMRMSTLLKDTRAKKHSLNATNVKETVRNYAVQITEEKRGFLEQVGIESLSRALTPAERRVQDKQIGNTVKQLPGKLDHATIAVYQVGRLITDIPEDVRRTHSPTHPYVFNRPTNDHVHSRTHTLDSYSGGKVHNQVV